MAEIRAHDERRAEFQRKRRIVGADGAQGAVPRVRSGFTRDLLLRYTRAANVVQPGRQPRPGLRHERRNPAEREGERGRPGDPSACEPSAEAANHPRQCSVYYRALSTIAA